MPVEKERCNAYFKFELQGCMYVDYIGGNSDNGVVPNLFVFTTFAIQYAVYKNGDDISVIYLLLALWVERKFDLLVESKNELVKDFAKSNNHDIDII